MHTSSNRGACPASLPFEALLGEFGAGERSEGTKIPLEAPDKLFNPLEGPKELLDAFCKGRGRPGEDLLHLFIFRFHSARQNQVSKELDTTNIFNSTQKENKNFGGEKCITNFTKICQK